MLQRVIPIVPAGTLPPARPRSVGDDPSVPRLAGDMRRALQVLAALEAAVCEQPVPADWLRELRLERGEACVALAPGLPLAEGRWLAQTTFDTLRRLLPDTDIYVGTARSAAAH